MASSRPLYRDALTTLSSLPTKHHPLHNIATLGSTPTTSMAAFDSTTPPEPRLPSIRPLDYRWDQSRAHIFNKHRSVLYDHRWSSHTPITFAETPASRRSYARRLPPQSKSQPVAPQAVNDGPIGAMDAMYRSTSAQQGWVNQEVMELREEHALEMEGTKRSYEELLAAQVIDMKEERQKHAKTMAALEDRMRRVNLRNEKMNARVENEKELEARTKAIEEREAIRERDLEDARSKANKELDQQFQDVSGQRKVVERRQRQVEKDEQAIRNRKQEVESDHAKAKIGLESSQKQQNVEFEAKLEKLKGTFREHMQILDKSLQERYKEGKELALEDAQARKDAHRSDYASYHQLWLTLWDAGWDMKFEAIINKLKEQCDFWNHSRAQFPQLTEQYSELRHTFKTHFESHIEPLESLVHSLLVDTKEWRGIRTALVSSSHISRSLTRYHRFGIGPNHHNTTEALEYYLWEGPLDSIVLLLRQEIEMIGLELKLATSDGEKHGLRGKQAMYRQSGDALRYLAKFLSFDKRMKALQALRHDSPLEKAVYFNSEKLRDMVKDASGAVQTYKRDLIRRNDGKLSSDQLSASIELDKQYRQLRGDLSEVDGTTRQIIILDDQLGESKIDEQELNGKIDERIARTEKDGWGVLQMALGMRMPIVRTGAMRLRDRAPVEVVGRTPGFRRLEQNAVKPSTTGDLKDIERQLAELNKKIKLDSYASDEAKQRDVKERDRLKLRSYGMKIANLKRIRAARAQGSGSRTSHAERLDTEIAYLVAAIRAQEAAMKHPTGPKPIGDQDLKSEPSAPVDGTESSGIVRKSNARPTRRLSSKSQPVRMESPESSAAATTSRSTASSKSDTRESGGTQSSRTHGVGFGIPATAGSQPSSSIRKAPRDNEGVAQIGGLGLRPTASQQMVFMAMPTNDEKWEATPAAAPGLDLSTLLDSLSRVNMASQASDTAPAAVQQEDEHSAAGIQGQSTNSRDISSIADTTSVSPANDTGSNEPIASIADKDEVDSLYEPSETQDSHPAPTSSMESEDDGEEQFALGAAAVSDSEPSYRIPPEDYRKAALASQSTTAAFWTYKLYKNAAGHSPTIHYCTTYEQAEVQAKHFLTQPIVGFDLEWEQWASPERSSIKDCVSLVQIASEDRIGLFHLALFKGETVDELLPPSLRTILESRDIAKAGVNVAGDAGRLQKCLNVGIAGYFELSHLYRVVTYSETSPREVNRKLYGLAAQVQNVLLLPLLKGEVRVSAWSKKLRMDQTEYAANDAYAGFQLYRTLDAKRKRMIPMPPRPAYWEEHQPLVLGDGRKMVAKASTPRRKGKALAGKATVEEEDGDDEDQEFFDAVESLDETMIRTVQTAGVPLSGLSVVYPTLPKLENADEPSQSTSKGTAAAQDATAGPSKSTSNKRPGPPPSTQVDLAESWIVSWRTSLPAEYNLRVGHATLRAYHLWHEQSLSCTEVASLLRDPPLSTSTIASYVMEALQAENLPYDVVRAREVLAILPKAAHRRYYKIVGQVAA